MCTAHLGRAVERRPDVAEHGHAEPLDHVLQDELAVRQVLVLPIETF